MAVQTTSASPLTGELGQVISESLHDRCMVEEELGTWGYTRRIVEDGFRLNGSYRSAELSLDEPETERLLAAARSVVWEAQRRKLKRPFFMSSRGVSMFTTEARLALEENWQVHTPEGLWSDLQNLSYDDRALHTLRNFSLVEKAIGKGVHLPLFLLPYPGGYTPLRHDHSESPKGLIHASSGAEALIVLHHLVGKGLIVSDGSPTATGTTFFLTPAGYELVSQLHRGMGKVRRAFLVCRFIDELDNMYASCYKVVSTHSEVRCPIERVKDVHHVDRIDDKIVRMIEEATIVVVDLTEQNFNVAFEAGYALALRKPIVWTMREDAGDFRPPFDIQSQNILRWQPDRLDVFREALRFRMIAALDKATTNAPS